MSPEGRTRRLWIFDFDGTLSPLVSDRTAALLHPASRSLLGHLVSDPLNGVAVLSSRALDDLCSRVPVRGVFLGGGSGLEWRFPEGHRITPGIEAARRLEKARAAVMPELARLSIFPGVEIEDKRWSVAVHYRNVPIEAFSYFKPLIMELEKWSGIRVFEGPGSMEIQFLPSVNKSFGVRRLCRILKFDPSCGRILYAGDDENDSLAMRWVVRKGGTAVAVGGRVRVRGALAMNGPVDLARAVREMADARGPGASMEAGKRGAR